MLPTRHANTIQFKACFFSIVQFAWVVSRLRGFFARVFFFFQEAVPAGAELCGGDEIAASIAASIDALTAGVESAAVFKRDIGELVLRPL